MTEAAEWEYQESLNDAAMATLLSLAEGRRPSDLDQAAGLVDEVQRNLAAALDLAEGDPDWRGEAQRRAWQLAEAERLLAVAQDTHRGEVSPRRAPAPPPEGEWPF